MDGSDVDEEDDADGSEDEDDDIESDDANEEVDPEFRRKVAEALQVSGMADADAEDSDSKEDSDDDDISITMDDDQMLQLDEKLAEVFQQQRQGKTGKSESRKTDESSCCITDPVPT